MLAVPALLLLAEEPAHAYIDPGAGSLIYQALLAGLLGVGFALRNLIGFARARFGGRHVRSEKAEPDQR